MGEAVKITGAKTPIDANPGKVKSTINTLNVAGQPASSPTIASKITIQRQKHTHYIPYVYHHYPISLSLLLFLHLIFFHHWNTRKTRRNIQSSYRVVVRQRKFHRALLATVSHPADDGRGSDREEGMGFPRIRILPSSFLSLLRDLFRPILPGGAFSGLPLLVYASHLLWQVRALEEIYGPVYKRVLPTLGITSIVLDLGITSLWLRNCGQEGTTRRQHVNLAPSFSGNVQSSTSFASSQVNLTTWMLDRPSCGMSAIVSSLLVLYGSKFPHVGMNIIPFFSASPQSNFSAGGLGFAMNLFVLHLLSRRVHPFGVLTGILAGLFFELGLVTFLAISPYWSNCLLWTVIFASALSIRGSSQNEGTTETWIPCVDYVSWYSTETGQSNRRSSDDDDDDGPDRNENQEIEEEGEEDSFLSFQGHARGADSESHTDMERADGSLRGRFGNRLQQEGTTNAESNINSGIIGRAQASPRGNLIDP